MANPKRRTTRSSIGSRRSHQKLKQPSISKCPKCHEPKLSHRACPSCGYYKNREILTIKAKQN